MAPSLDTLPLETLLEIAEMCTWTILPSSTNPHPASYARSHAALVPSYLLWAVNVGNLDTVKRAHSYGAALDSSIEVTEETTYCPPWGVIEPNPEDLFYSLPYRFSFIHVAILRKHVAIAQYLLENGADVYAPSLNFGCDDETCRGAPLFPLHQCLFHDGVGCYTSAIDGNHMKTNTLRSARTQRRL
ncbi:unnamed protein product [Clonostachys chloroleuca]|uniref:Uncharacterized protein n=1 Tax=Clonostachys chloroleuca TaxID=1926264 RepID=A0AA35PXY1_9HYPO|nr:unnamed protein product [Clonostachys chloroleuca]